MRVKCRLNRELSADEKESSLAVRGRIPAATGIVYHYLLAVREVCKEVIFL